MKTLCRKLETHRLCLRRPQLPDATAVHDLAGDLRVSRTTALIPHPYTLAHALEWFDAIHDDFATGAGHTFVIERLAEPGVIGSAGLLTGRDGVSASVGYWIGYPYWRRGYATEALREILRYGFEELGLLRIHASHMMENAASGRVMQKAGMRFEGVIAQGCRRGDEIHDKVTYTLFADEWRTWQLPALL
ncbi:MAG: acetyltransferase [Akkermansiaceae bacterium]|nr:acetyltransferase [Akkermansiaceae bacterium]